MSSLSKVKVCFVFDDIIVFNVCRNAGYSGLSMYCCNVHTFKLNFNDSRLFDERVICEDLTCCIEWNELSIIYNLKIIILYIK